MFTVFDLDGTLADCSHRAHLIPNWESFYNDCIHDEPMWPTIKILQALKKEGHRIEIWTGRCESVRDLTNLWFEKHVGFRVPMKMRPKDYTLSNVELKRQWLQDYYNVMWPNIVFEDRTELAEMYRHYGIQVALVDSPSVEAEEKADEAFSFRRK